MQDRYRALKYFAHSLYVPARDHLEKILAWFVGGFLQIRPCATDKYGLPDVLNK